MMGQTNRRQFLAAAAVSGLAAAFPMQVLATSNAKPPNDDSDTGMVFLFQGDSITDGNRGRTPDPNHIMGHGYAFSIASRIGADFPAAGFRFFNRGVSGNTLPDMGRRWQEDTLNLKPGVLSILIGINDTAAVVENRPGAQTVAAFEAQYRQLLETGRAVNANCIFVLGLPFVYAVGKRKENWVRWQEGVLQRAAVIKSLAPEFNAVLVDYPAVFDHAIERAPVDYWIWDGIHPTVPAHELMAREWIRQVRKRVPMLKKLSNPNK